MNIQNAIRVAAAAGPAYAGDLTAIQRRGRRYARRRTALKAGAVTAVLGTGSAFAIGLPHHFPTVAASPSVSAAVTASPPPSTPSPAAAGPWTSDQRLVLYTANSISDGQFEIDPGTMTGSTLMQPDGRIVSHKFGADPREEVGRFIPLPDGRFVVLRRVNVGSRTAPDPAHPDGSSNPDIRIRLQIVDGREHIQVSHEVRRLAEEVQLLAATADSAYLARPEGVVRHDFATGRETLLVSTKALGTDLSTGAAWTSLEGGRLAIARGDLNKPWFVDVFDVSTGQRIVSYPLSVVDARWAGPLRLSPDGRRVATFYRINNGDSRLIVLDLASQAILVDRSLVDSNDTMLNRFDADLRIWGVAWSDNSTLRIAWAQLPPGARGKYTLDKITTMRTIVVG